MGKSDYAYLLFIFSFNYTYFSNLVQIMLQEVRTKGTRFFIKCEFLSVAKAWLSEKSNAWPFLDGNINRRGTLKSFSLHNYSHHLITDMDLGGKTNLILIISEKFFLPLNALTFLLLAICATAHLPPPFQQRHFIPQMETENGLCPPCSMPALPLGARCLGLCPGAFCLPVSSPKYVC